jgi:hypothetical protein
MTGSAYRLHHRTACGWQTRGGGHNPLNDIVLLSLAAKIILRVSPPMPVHTLLLSNKETKSSDGRHLVLLLCVGRCRL